MSAGNAVQPIADYGAAPLGLGVTRDLATFLAQFRYDDLPAAAVHEARRGLLDWIGCALAGSRHRTIAKLVGVLRTVAPDGGVRVIAHGVQLGMLEAAIANGQMGHVLDYDDTHMGGVVLHTSSPVLAACLALAERRPVSGRNLVAAYAAGFEAGVRVGAAAPGHHDGGWHLTGTLGTISAAASVGRLLDLDPKRMIYALGIAATQSAGMQQNRGTMCKSLHAGKAASNGLLAALLAEQEFDSSDEIIEGKRGFCRIYSNVARPEAALADLGTRWEIARNGHKPYACGVVLHPLIDAMIGLGARGDIDPAAIERMELTVHPIAVRITGVVAPETGLKSKFSVYHSAAVAFLDRDAGIVQYGDERSKAADVIALRDKVRVVVADDFRKDEAHAAIVLSDGRRIEHHVDHASGTVDNPMSDRAIETKFLANAVPVIGEDRARRIAELAWRLEAVDDVRVLNDLCA